MRLELSVKKIFNFFGDFKRFEVWGNSYDLIKKCYSRERICRIIKNDDFNKSVIVIDGSLELKSLKKLTKFIEQESLKDAGV